VAEELPDDPTLVMEVLFDIRKDTGTSSICSRKTMGNKKQRTAEERAAWRARSVELDRRLEEAIARRKAEAAQRRRAAGGSG
jgi:hypothetical protein